MTAETTPPDVQALLQLLNAQDAEIQRLRALVEPDAGAQPRTRSRRDLLKLAGAAVVGAAGAAALRAVPVAAANGDPVLVGGSYTGTTTTSLTTAGSAGFQATGTTAGVIGTGGAGSGVQGISASGPGVYGNSASGIGGVFIGGRSAITLPPFGPSGPPTTGIHLVGDIQLDSNGVPWVCAAPGNPGVFVPLQPGGANQTHFARVSNQQYNLANSDGRTWVDIDSAGLALTITPMFNAQAVISVSADLWTANAGYNQDIGIFISGERYGTGQIVAWKESGGFAGTFSPNAAFVETTQPLAYATQYTIKLRWKTNKPATGATIYAGAGPLDAASAGGGVPGQYSPTRLAVHLVADSNALPYLR